MYLRILTQHYPGLEATLFEAPAVAAIAQQTLAAAPGGARIAVVAGDFFHGPIPSGHDAVLLANIIHIFSPEHNLALLARQVRRRTGDHPPACRLLDQRVPYSAGLCCADGQGVADRQRRGRLLQCRRGCGLAAPDWLDDGGPPTTRGAGRPHRGADGGALWVNDITGHDGSYERMD